MIRKTDFRPIIKRILKHPEYTFERLGHECGCSATNIRRILSKDEIQVPNYDMGVMLKTIDQRLKRK